MSFLQRSSHLPSPAWPAFTGPYSSRPVRAACSLTRRKTFCCRSRRAGRFMCSAEEQPWTIIGGGRVGSALSRLGSNDVVVKRGESIPEDSSGPIVVATRNDSLQGIVDATPKHRRSDLIFIQNGMIQPFLDQQGLGDNTQVLVFFAVAKMGEMPSGGTTRENPEGLTAAYGKHAAAFAKRLHSGDLTCKVLTKDGYKKAMLEKLVWISAFMLVGQQHGKTVGEVVTDHRTQVTTLITELAIAGAVALDIKLNPGLVERLIAYGESVSHFPTAVKEFEWRNGWFYGLTQKAKDQGQEDPCPLHTSLLKQLKVVKA